MTKEKQGQLLDMLVTTSELVAAYVSNNNVPVAELPALIGNVHAALSGITDSTRSEGADAPAENVERPTAAQVKKSIRLDGLVSFLDGKIYQTLKRHLTANGLDPQTYRKRFGLPSDYPMVTASYSAKRSTLSKSFGLGRRGRMRG